MSIEIKKIKKVLYSFKIQDCTLRLQSLWNDRTSSGKLSVSHSSGNQHPDYCKTWNEPFTIIIDANLDIVNDDSCEKLDYFYSNSSFKMTSSKLVCNFMYNQLVKENKKEQKKKKNITGFSRPLMICVTPRITPLAWLVNLGLLRSSSSVRFARNPKYCPLISG